MSTYALSRRTLPVLFKLAHVRSLSELNESNDLPNYDVVVVGAGLVGAAFTRALRANSLTADLKVALVDREQLSEPLSPVNSSYIPSARVSTITPANVSFLKHLGAWSHEVDARAASFDSMQVWDTSGLGHVRYSAAEAGASSLGRVVENHVLQSSLHQLIKECPLTEVVSGAGVESLHAAGEEHDHRAVLALEGGARLKARLVVAADGASSRVRELAGVRTVGWWYNQHAVVSTVRTDFPTSTAWQRFLRTGPIALLPSAGGFANVVWSTTAARAALLAKMSPPEFTAAVNEALHSPATAVPEQQPTSLRLPDVLGLGELAADLAARVEAGLPGPALEAPPYVVDAPGHKGAFPLQLSQAARYVVPRVALIGDAAHAVHPLAGQGVNMGFTDAMVLAQVLDEALRTGGDIGCVSVLKQYERQQQMSNTAMMAGLDGLQRLFDSEDKALTFVRAAGLRLVNSAPSLKKQIILYAMGNVAPSDLASDAQKRLAEILGGLGVKLPTSSSPI